MELLEDNYLLLKALHIIFVIFWCAGLFMAPRFFAYHHQCDVDSEEDLKWQDREKRLFKIILNPSMIIVLILGLMLSAIIGAAAGTWFTIKFALGLILMVFHMYLARERKKLIKGERPHTEKFYRLINEVPGIFIIIIVILAVMKPF